MGIVLKPSLPAAAGQASGPEATIHPGLPPSETSGGSATPATAKAAVAGDPFHGSGNNSLNFELLL